MTAPQGGVQTPPGLDRLEALPRLAEDAAENVVDNWPEYLGVLQDPSLYAAVGGVCLAGAGALAGLRTGARRLAEKPGDIVLGRSREGRLDRLFRNPVVAGWIDRTHHVELVRPTGSGKTTTLLPQAVQDLVCGHTVVVEEIYGDLGTGLIPYAIALGRPLFVFDPSLPDSLCWNPLAGEDDDEVVGHFYGPAARTLEDAILTGGLSPDDMEMPDMMLAGISGDQMALAAARDGDASPGVGPAPGTDDGDEAAGALAGADGGADVTGSAGKGPVADATVDELAGDAVEENPDGFASPALGGDPEPIVEKYAAASPTEETAPAEESGPVGPEMASADTGDAPAASPSETGEATGAEPASDTGSDAGTETATEPAQSDELAYTPVPDDGASEEDETSPAEPGPQEPQPQETAPQEPEPVETELAEPAADEGAAEGYDAGEAPPSTPAPAPEDDSSPPEFASAEQGRPDDGYSYTSEAPSGEAEAPGDDAPPRDAPSEDLLYQESDRARGLCPGLLGYDDLPGPTTEGPD